jgi:NOL1/NOP2/sun family putative RNA methylase
MRPRKTVALDPDKVAAEKAAALEPQDGDDTPQHRETGEFFLNRYRQIDEKARFIDPATLKVAIRVNTLRIADEEMVRQLKARLAVIEKIDFLRHGYYARASFSFGATPEYLMGLYYMQAPLSQLACEVLDPPQGATVLDMASAPGSKTTYLAALVGKSGKVIALDNDMHRLASVRNNAERMGATNIVCVKKDSRFANDFDTQFTHILLDAPCSGNYCSEDGWVGKRTIQHIRENARTQRELLRSAIGCLAPGGRLLYSTCSLEPEEDELVVDWALGKFQDVTIIPLNNLPIGDHGTTKFGEATLDPRVAGTRRFWPHKTGMEGFFIALLEKHI